MKMSFSMNKGVRSCGKKAALALVLVALGAVGGPSCARASAPCYSPAEVEAEQALRLHSELMVITVTCHQDSMGRDLVRAYTGFTRDNIDMLHRAEATMTAYYKKAYGGKGVDRLDRLRTMLANEYGQKIADRSAQTFCAENRDKVTAFYGISPASVHGAVLQVSGRSYAPVCSVQASERRKSR